MHEDCFWYQIFAPNGRKLYQPVKNYCKFFVRRKLQSFEYVKRGIISLRHFNPNLKKSLQIMYNILYVRIQYIH